MEDLAVAYIEPKLFWTAGFFVIVGPSGSGKTTIIRNALRNPRKYIALPPDKEVTLWVLVGASHDLQAELEPQLDGTVFTEVNFTHERLGECDALRSAVESNDARRAHCIVVDDYMAYSAKDGEFIRQMLHRYKRHEHLCVVVALHNLQRDRTNTVWEMVDFADRVFLTKSPGNLKNLEALLQRLRLPLSSSQRLRREFTTDRALPPEEKRYGVLVYDRRSTYLVSDYKALSEGTDQKLMFCYGESDATRFLVVA